MRDFSHIPTLLIAENDPERQEIWHRLKGHALVRVINADIRVLLQTKVDAIIMPGWAVHERLGGRPQIGKCSILRNEGEKVGQCTWAITTPTFAASREDARKYQVPEAPQDPRTQNFETFSRILDTIVDHNDRFPGSIREVAFEPRFLNFSGVYDTYQQEVVGVLDAWRATPVLGGQGKQ